MLRHPPEVDRLLQSLLSSGSAAGVSDAQLLRQLGAPQRDTAALAFETLMERHGPMVLRVCRRALRDPHEANDAFQATFLVLLRSAKSLRRPEALASWLHGVALRAARCLARQAGRRREIEARTARSIEESYNEDAEGRELGHALHEAIHGLPAGERQVVVLCELEGRSYLDAARELDCPIGTIKSRLSGAKRRLRARLTKRGFAPASVVLAAALAREASASAVPALLRDVTTRVASTSRGLASKAGVDTVSISVSTLVQGVLNSMAISKVKLASLVLVPLLLSTAVIWAQSAPGGGPFAPQDPADDRLGAVERKLDRLIDVLERSASARSESVSGQRTANGAATTAVDPFFNPDARPALATAGTAVNGSLEQRIAKIEQRLIKLESAVFRLPAGDSLGPAAKASNVGTAVSTSGFDTTTNAAAASAPTTSADTISTGGAATSRP